MLALPLSLENLPLQMPFLEQATLAPNSRILARTDLNIPLAADGSPASFARIDALLPLLRQTKNHTLLLCSHFGRPQEHIQNKEKLSLQPLIPFLEQRWQRKILFLGDCTNSTALDTATLATLNEGNTLGLFENLRFHAGEEQNDLVFAASLKAQADLYVNDAFSVCHRAHASTSAITNLLPSYAGPSLRNELETLLPLLATTEHHNTEPQKSIALLGGAKVSTKIDLLQSLKHRCSAICLGGAMANCFLAARGILSAAAFDEKELQSARLLERQFQELKEPCLLLLPVDGACVPESVEAGAGNGVAGKAEGDFSERIEMPLAGSTASIGDIGSESCRAIEELLDKATHGTRVVVNGPVGIVERPPCDVATLRLLRFLAVRTKRGLLRTIAGGGDTLAALERAGVQSQFTHLSLGGGAFLELLSGETLPALEALLRNKRRFLS